MAGIMGMYERPQEIWCFSSGWISSMGCVISNETTFPIIYVLEGVLRIVKTSFVPFRWRSVGCQSGQIRCQPVAATGVWGWPRNGRCHLSEWVERVDNERNSTFLGHLPSVSDAGVGAKRCNGVFLLAWWALIGSGVIISFGIFLLILSKTRVIKEKEKIDHWCPIGMVVLSVYWSFFLRVLLPGLSIPCLNFS